MKDSAEFAWAVLGEHPEGLTRMDALKAGIGNMPARAQEIRQAGLPIRDEWTTTLNGARIKRWLRDAPVVSPPMHGRQEALAL